MGERVVSQHDCVLPRCGLRTRIFYGADAAAAAHAPRARWMPQSATAVPDDNVRALAHYLGVPGGGVLASVAPCLLRVSLPWAADAPAAHAPAGGPLVLVSHGLGSSLAGYVSLCAALVRAGCTAVAVEHGDGSAHCAYIGAERRALPYVHRPRDVRAHDELAATQNEHRIRELDAVLGDLRRMSQGVQAEPLVPRTARIDFTGRFEHREVVVAGHSFGGATALGYALAARCGMTTATVRKVVCLDPWLTPIGRGELRGLDLGALQVLVVDQELTGATESVYLLDSMAAPSGGGALVRVVVAGGAHNNATDFATKLPRMVAVVGKLAAPRVDPELAMEAQNGAVAQFVTGNWVRYEARVKGGQVNGLRMR